MSNKLAITDFGAMEGTISTHHIQKAIDAANELGGATVVVPKGTYITGTINLGNASLHLEKGAVLKGSSNPSDYYDNGFVHNEMNQCISLLFSLGHDNISITGEGTVDLNGSVFFDYSKREIPYKNTELDSIQIQECTATYTFRPTQPIFFCQCNNISMKGVTVLNAPCWTLTFSDCENIHIDGLTILNDLVIPNNDGMHFCGCRKVFIQGCNIVSGDDCIAISGITDWDKPCENFVISDCVLQSSSKAIVLGYMHSIVRNICISNCIIEDSQRGICIMASTDTGLVEHVLVENVRIDTRIRAGNWWGNGEPICIFSLYHHNPYCLLDAPQRKLDVNINDVQFRNISCSGENFIGIAGKNKNVQNIIIDGLYFERKPSKNSYLKGKNAMDTSPANDKIEAEEDDANYWILIQECKNITVKESFVQGFNGQTLKSSVTLCENVEML